MTARTFVVTFDRPICKPFAHVSNLPTGEPRSFCRVMAADPEDALRIAARRHPDAVAIRATPAEH